MIDPATTIGSLAAGGVLWEFAKDACKHVATGSVYNVVNHAAESVRREFAHHRGLPPNHHLDKAFLESLGQATRLLAFYLHEPDRREVWHLIGELQAGKLVGRLGQFLNRNIVAGTPQEHWLASLIDLSKAHDNFKDFDLAPLFQEAELTRLLRDETDTVFRDYIQTEFLAWVDRHVTANNPQRPPEFEKAVVEGWGVDRSGVKRTFYDIFCIFFREELKTNQVVFNAFALKVDEKLVHDVAEIKQALPNPAMWKQVQATLNDFSGFQTFITAENEKLAQNIHEALKPEFERIYQQGEEIKAKLKPLEQLEKLLPFLPGILEQYINQKQQQSSARVEPAEQKLDIPHTIREWALKEGFSPDQVQKQLDQWIAETLKHSTDLTKRAQAEFLAGQFDEAARLADEAAEASLARSQKLTAASQRQEDAARTELAAAVENLIRAGVALGSQYKPAEALKRFEKALLYCPRETTPIRWAELQNRLGICYNELSYRSEGYVSSQYLTEAITAYRAALEVYTRREFAPGWAATQNNLGYALRDLAGRTSGEAGGQYLTEAITAYRAALEVYTRREFAPDWAMTQNNLGLALSDLARRTSGEAGGQYLAEAITAYRAALEVYTRREFAPDWAATQYNLGNALRYLAKRSEKDEAKQLLKSAIAAFDMALEVFTAEHFPDQHSLVCQSKAQAEEALRGLD